VFTETKFTKKQNPESRQASRFLFQNPGFLFSIIKTLEKRLNIDLNINEGRKVNKPHPFLLLWERNQEP
jgi:hypothetical protein